MPNKNLKVLIQNKKINFIKIDSKSVYPQKTLKKCNKKDTKKSLKNY